MRWKINQNGFTIVEIIVGIAVIGTLVGPLGGIFVMSARINRESSMEFKSLLEAQKYMEEIKVMESIDVSEYPYNAAIGAYERTTAQTEDSLGVRVLIIPEGDILYSIEINIIDEDNIVNSLFGSSIFY